MNNWRTIERNFAEFCDLVPNFSFINQYSEGFLWETETYWIWWFFCSPPVRRASANVVSIVAKYAVPAGEWPDLLPFLFQCSQSAQEDHREVSSSCWKDFFLYSMCFFYSLSLFSIVLCLLNETRFKKHLLRCSPWYKHLHLLLVGTYGL